MKNIIIAFLFLVLTAAAQLTPQTVPLSWSRSDVTAYADTNIYLAGVTYRLTNAMAYISTTPSNGVPQSLTNLTIWVRAGDNNSNQLFYGTADLSSNGLFSADFQFPAWRPSPDLGVVRQMGLELTLLDPASGIVITYNARKLFDVTPPMAGNTTALLLNTIPVTAVYSNQLVYFDASPAGATGFVFRISGTNIVGGFHQ